MPQRISEQETAQQMSGLKGWTRDGQAIRRQYKFSGFVPAMAFVNHVAGVAESMDHHPDILIEYDQVTLKISTHSAGGLTELDFNLAKKIDA